MGQAPNSRVPHMGWGDLVEQGAAQLRQIRLVRQVQARLQCVVQRDLAVEASKLHAANTAYTRNTRQKAGQGFGARRTTNRVETT